MIQRNIIDAIRLNLTLYEKPAQNESSDCCAHQKFSLFSVKSAYRIRLLHFSFNSRVGMCVSTTI